MKYFIDTEFLEGTQKKFIGETVPTIDLVSIALVDQDGRSLYLISKEFNLKEAWNRWQQRTGCGDRNNIEPKEYWIRENVLLPIFNYMVETYRWDTRNSINWDIAKIKLDFTYGNFKMLLNKYGKTRMEIAYHICGFIYGYDFDDSGMSAIEMARKYEHNDKSKNPIFYGYYADYDWVVFCWIFGNMMNLPKGFPMYCRDLKQMLDESVEKLGNSDFITKFDIQEPLSLNDKLKEIKKNNPNYPKQTNAHDALADAMWNKELYNFIQTIQ